MYEIIVEFKPTRDTLVYGGRNEGLNYWYMSVESETTGDREHSSGGGIGRQFDCWNCGGGGGT